MTKNEQDFSKSKLIFCGTGVSTALPVMGHLNHNCACRDALLSPKSPNKRNNVSILLQLAETEKNFLVDCGKTFRDAYFNTLAPRQISTIDAVLLTHDHQDAIAGIDDLRDLQRFEPDPENAQGWICRFPMPIFCSNTTFQTVQRAYPYLMDRASVSNGHEPDTEMPSMIKMERRAACLRFLLVDDQSVKPLKNQIFGKIPMISLPVFHGGNYRCLGLAFGGGLQAEGKQTVVYLSDISEFPKDVLEFLRTIPNGIDILVIDVLNQQESHFSHFTLKQAVTCVFELQPRQAFGVGMFCDIEHHAENKTLKKMLDEHKAAHPTSRIEKFELAFDGLELDVDL